MRLIALAALLAYAVTARAAAPAEFPHVADTSFVEANGDRSIQLSIIIAAPPEKVFAAFATIEGWKSWAVPFALGEPRVGGVIETSYDPAAKAGDPGNIQNQIAAWIPNRLVVLKNLKAPAGFEHADLFAKTATIIELAPEGAGTKVTLSGVGFGAGPGFDALYAGFSWGNAYGLENLKRAVEDGPIDWAKALKE
ncbi:hypothetical protein sos41_01650 [Alphaproteobacteria bacterium SO-S41]|nr:hypothetical protein sos41_01650 [Alphaproteobacteria bacterium SO-S41]